MPSNYPVIEVSISRRPHLQGQASQPTPPTAQGSPLVWLGAKSPGGLGLPDARPTPSQMYAPRGVWIDDQRLIVCDSGNHRVLIWNTVPEVDGQPADIVLGQEDFTSEGPASGNQNYANGFQLPTGVIVADGKLLVADAWHHRILVWHQIPNQSGTRPDYCIGQADLMQVQPNRGGDVNLQTLYWPYGLAYIEGALYVADTGNRRVLVWNSLPDVDRPADFLLGQPNEKSAEENRGGGPAADSFRWPHAIAGDASQLWVADAGNHRILGWTQPLKQDRPADFVLGQPDFQQAGESPYELQGGRKLRFPYCLAIADSMLAAADTANNRILFWKRPIAEPVFAAAQNVIGQPDFLSVGENHWQAVTHNSLCWPYGISWNKNRMAIADSGNNRVVIWDCESFHLNAN